MQNCHLGSITLLDTFIGQLSTFKKKNALEVAAGDARLSKDLLRTMFNNIDCFD